MNKVCTKVEVSFLLPGYGHFKEVYSLLDSGDIFCWKANNKRTATIQTGVKEIEFEHATESLLAGIKDANLTADKMMTQYKKGETE